MTIEINPVDPMWFERADYDWKYHPFCVEKPIEHGVEIAEESDTWHICILNNGGYAFFTNTDERNCMTKEEVAQEYANENRIEVTFSEMCDIAILRTLRNLDRYHE